MIADASSRTDLPFSRVIRGIIALVLTGVSLYSCGPALTTPSSADISGTWVASGPVAGMTNISVALSQAPSGSLTGTYTAIGSAPLHTCPLLPPCALSGAVSGVNTVVQVFFSMADAGTFTGQVIAPGTMKGAISHSKVEPIQFTRP
jgi:hypothetical protein